MGRTRGLTPTAVRNLQASGSRYEVPDPGCPGLYISVHPSGAKSWCYRFRFGGRSRKLTIGPAYNDAGVEVIKLGDARDVADEARVLVAKRVDPIEATREEQKREAARKAAAENTLRAVGEEYINQRLHLRSAENRRKVFERLVFPTLGDQPIETIKRSEITRLLDVVAKTRGAAMADHVLATLRGLLNWYAVRSDDYVSPIRPGMARTSTKERARNRTLTRAEIQALWRVADEAGMFGRYCQFTLLTAVRRNEAAHMRRSEMNGDEWTIPAPRYKTKVDHVVPLSGAAVAVLNSVPKTRSDFVFTPDGKKPLSGFGCQKEKIDKLMLAQLRKIAEEVGDDPSCVTMRRWTLHDLRRTARTLLSEAGVQSDHAEACLGHVVKGVEGVYNRYAYKDEKKAAFEKLADLIDRIVSRGSNVVAFAERASVNLR